MITNQIAIIGTGAFATALASVLSSKIAKIKMYGIVQKQIDDINIHHNNSSYYDIHLPPNVSATNDLDVALKNVSYVFLAVPAAFAEDVVTILVKKCQKNTVLICLVKGVNPQASSINELFFANVFPQQIKKSNIHNVVFLYGPNIAKEIAHHKPVFCTLSCDATVDALIISDITFMFEGTGFYISLINDNLGVNICSVFKNIVALLAGISFGFYESASTLASVVTLAWNEIIQFGLKNGVLESTFNSFAGLGDLFLTAHSQKSRNFSLGYQIGKSHNVDEAVNTFHLLSEGYNSCRLVYEVFQSNNSFPIAFIQNLYKVLFQKGSLRLFFDNFFKKQPLK